MEDPSFKGNVIVCLGLAIAPGPVMVAAGLLVATVLTAALTGWSPDFLSARRSRQTLSNLKPPSSYA